MSNEKKEQGQPQEKKPEGTNAFRVGFMSGYTNDNPSADASINGFYAGYVGTRPGAGQKAEDAKL